MYSLAAMFFTASLVFQNAGITEPIVKADSISVHQVRRGPLPLREMAAGAVTSVQPAKVTLSRFVNGGGDVRVGQIATMQIGDAHFVYGKVTQVKRRNRGETVTAELQVSEPLPTGTSVGLHVEGVLIDSRHLPNAVFFERPADSRPNTNATIFLIEPDGQHAKRVKVRYGQQSGPIMEIISGLSPGDRVIVTDMSAYAGLDRVRLQ
jgi:multidrug efflux pump subunit AcrA (membrane-fusion protein)